jgi:hypothetical protein
MVSVAASVAVIVRIEVVALATVEGVAVIVTVGTLSVLLPTNRAHPDMSAENPTKALTRRTRENLMGKGAVAKILSLTSIWTRRIDKTKSEGLCNLPQNLYGVKKPPIRRPFYERESAATRARISSLQQLAVFGCCTHS